MNVSLKGIDCLQKSFDGILFSSYVCIIPKAMFIVAALLCLQW